MTYDIKTWSDFIDECMIHRICVTVVKRDNMCKVDLSYTPLCQNFTKISVSFEVPSYVTDDKPLDKDGAMRLDQALTTIINEIEKENNHE